MHIAMIELVSVDMETLELSMRVLRVCCKVVSKSCAWTEVKLKVPVDTHVM